MSTGEIDSESPQLANYDLLVLTTEKLDSLLGTEFLGYHKLNWLLSMRYTYLMTPLEDQH